MQFWPILRRFKDQKTCDLTKSNSVLDIKGWNLYLVLTAALLTAGCNPCTKQSPFCQRSHQKLTFSMSLFIGNPDSLVMLISRMLVGWDSSKPQHGPYCLNIFLVRPRYFGHWMSPSKDMPIIVVWYYLFKHDYLFFICHPDWLNTLFSGNIHVI